MKVALPGESAARLEVVRGTGRGESERKGWVEDNLAMVHLPGGRRRCTPGYISGKFTSPEGDAGALPDISEPNPQ
jgi:hypothetical protein